MDEVWLVSLCFAFLAFVVVLLSSRRADNESDRSAKAKERSPEPEFASAQPAARFMEMTLQDMEKSLERLGAVLGAEPGKGQQPAQHREPTEHSAPGRQVKIKPSEQTYPRTHGGGEGIEILEHPPITSSTRNIMEQIEQAVQETPDQNRERSEYIRVRRAPLAPRLETPPRDDVLQSRSWHSSD